MLIAGIETPSKAQYIIRSYTPADLQQIIAIYQAVFNEPPWNETWSAKQIESDLEFALTERGPIALVAETTMQERANNTILGFTWGYVLPQRQFPFLENLVPAMSVYMDEIAVQRTNRIRGIGKALTEEFCKQAATSVVLRTDQRNTASMKLFTTTGFRPIKTSPEQSLYDPEYPNRIYLQRMQTPGGNNGSN